jgi:hypothetical protein
VRGGAHQPPVQLAGANEEVEHLASDHARVEHLHTLRQQALAIVRGQLGGAEAHIVSKSHAQLLHGLARESGEHVRERAADLLCHLAVDLLAVEAADVVRREDLGWGRGAHALAILRIAPAPAPAARA